MQLKELRDNIDNIDFQILKLLNERYENALKISKLKDKIEDQNREQEIFEKVKNNSFKLLDASFITDVYKKIITYSRELQSKDLKLIGFQGEHGAYSEEAAITYNREYVPIPFSEFKEIFDNVEKGILDYGIVPVENSIGGAVTEVNDLLLNTNLYIVGEMKIKINHCLLKNKETDYRDLRVVYSHPQALAQCRNFLIRNKLEARPYYNTAGAAKMLASEKPNGAAVIAGKLCAKLYNLEIIKENIEDNYNNITRFVIIAKQPSEKGNKCSIVFSTPHKAGTLFNILKIFAEAKINLTRIESISMIEDKLNYAFFLDFIGNPNDKIIGDTLNKVKKETSMYKFLGCYQESKIKF